MGAEKLYLKQNVVVEPLFNRWYATSHLISPATAAMYMAGFLKSMQSFVSAPEIHRRALENPALKGGPFINHPASRAGEVRALMERTAKENAHLLAFADAVKELDELLSTQTDGHSLEPLYRKVPDRLRGYVELVYDMRNSPAARFIEGLLYKSPLYRESLQSVAVFLTGRDGRPFAFNTPRLESAGTIHLPVAFSDPRLDELSKMKDEPQSYDYIKTLLEVSDQQDGVFSTFFTERRVSPPAPDRAGVRVRYFGHACLAIESKGVSILCDPVISYDYPSEPERFTYSDLPESIDYILITHNHQDHCLLETLLQLRHRTRTVVVPKNNVGLLADPSLKMALQKAGFRDVREIDELEEIPVAGGRITGIPFLGEHGDLNVRSKIAYLLDLDGCKVMMAADSNNLEPKLYEHLRDLAPDLDALFIGMECDGAPMSWIYGPLLTKPLPRSMDQSRRFDASDSDKAIEIVRQLNPKQVYVYAMGLEPWLTYVIALEYTEQSRPIVESDKLVSFCMSRRMVAERLFCKKEILLRN